ncbi:hypothetical protein GCM10011529_19860 [Polymorphobacter glacialis]|uniref:Peptidase M28 domain-containing protein n=2 Tax=Sandarakinorhabdus glacialis TaxID=1614636 RepID=A0A917E9Y8_9SPHN|nr:hypothetical protein GCM10011529_19860 [Polymorphobacter glacialis]
MARWLALVVTLVAAAFLGFAAARPPLPVPASAPADQFSAIRAMGDVRVIARAPHPTGSAANDAVRAHLVARLQDLGFTVRETSFPMPDKARRGLVKRGTADAATGVNITALRPGRDPAAPAVALMAHYDSVPGSPGAADDAAGVAAALEIARAIPRSTQARDLVVLLTDAEEAGLVGARAFFAPGIAGDPLADRIGVLVNMETRGGGGRAFMFETGADNGAMMALYRRVVANPTTTAMAVKIYALLPNSTDFTPVRKRGIPGFNFAFTGDARLYHSPLATPDAVDQGSIQHMGGQALGITRALVTAGALPPAAPDAIFADVFGLFTLSYPVAMGWLLLGVAAVLLVAAARRRRADWTGWGLAAAGLDAVTVTLTAGVLLYLGNLLSGADAPVNYYDRLAALPRLETQALLLMLASLAITVAMLPRRHSRRHPRRLWSGWIGLAGLNLVIAAAAQVWLPAAGPILAWPLLVALVAMTIAARAPDTVGTIAAMVAAILGLAWLGSLAHGVLLGIGTGMPSVTAVFAPLGLMLLWPLLPHTAARRPLLIAALLLVVAAGSLALWVRVDAPAPLIPAYTDSK